MASDTASDAEQAGAAIDWSVELARHRPWLKSVVLARVGDRHAAEDVLQEVAVAAVKENSKRKASLTDADKVAPWLYRVAVRQALLFRRKAGRRNRLMENFQADGAVRQAEDDRNPLDWLLAKERGAVVLSALDRLDPRDAEMLLLKYTQDWSYRQIAQRLGVSEGAVESRLHRARKKLRDALSNYKLDAQASGSN